jgi:hypothetical protein
MILSRPRARASTFTPTVRCCPATATRNSRNTNHFYGHYGTAWQNQAKEFAAFPGAILMTTNCIQKPKNPTRTTSYHRSGGLARRAAHRRQGFHPGDRQGAGNARLSRRTPGKEVMVGFAATRLWAWRTGDRSGQEQGHPAFLPGGRLRRRQTRPQLLHRIRRKGARGLRGPDPGLRQVPLSSTRIWATSAAFRACWISGSATMPIRPFRSPWPWPAPSNAASTTCRSP